MLASQSSVAASRPWPIIHPGLGITDKGVVCDKDLILVPMIKGGDGLRLGLDAAQDRLLALLSVMGNKPVAAADVQHHFAAASAHWRRGDKALANLRLVFSNLPKLDDPAAAHRLRVAADLLDDGFCPAALMKALWPEPLDRLERYAPDQPRVPAGNGRRSGEWEARGSGRSPFGNDGRFAVASGDKKTLPEANSSEFDEISGRHPPDPGAHAAALPDPLDGLPAGIGRGPFAGRSIPAGPSAKPSTAQRLEIDAIGRKTGCHTCGMRDPGGRSGRFIADHQAPTALVKPGDQQYLFPHCDRCSRSQGGRVRAFKRKEL